LRYHVFRFRLSFLGGIYDMSIPRQEMKSGGSRRALLWLWTLGAGLVGAGVGFLVLRFENGEVNDVPGTAQEVFIFMQAALLLGVLAGALSPQAWIGKRRTAFLAALVGALALFLFVTVRVVQAGNGNGLFFGCFTIPFLVVSVLGGIFGSWLGALLADVRRGEE
jgi:FtsH-binding integral membrane protein